MLLDLNAESDPNAGRHLGFGLTGSSAIRSAYLENPTLEPNVKWIGRPKMQGRSVVGRRSSVLSIYIDVMYSSLLR